MSNRTKTVAHMVMNRIDLDAAIKAERKREHSKLMLEAFCNGLRGGERETVEKHHPELFAEGSNTTNEEY